MKGNRLTIELNGMVVVENSLLPDLLPAVPIDYNTMAGTGDFDSSVCLPCACYTSQYIGTKANTLAEA